jgi:hypothetical protein
MNVIARLVFMWYLFLTLLALFASISISISELVMGLILLWFIFICFWGGCSTKLYRSYDIPDFSDHRNQTKKAPLALLTLGSVIASLYAAKFYTGNSASEIIAVIRSHGSLYNQYQNYFAAHDLAVFSLAKIPAIFSLFYLKIAALYGFIYVIVLSPKINWLHCVYVLIISAATLFFSMARGTSFELFELMLLLLFSMAMRRFMQHQKGLSLRAKILLFALASIVLAAYSYNISARYAFGEVSSCSTYELCFSDSTLFAQLSIALAKLSFKLSSYFTFGLFYTSKFIEDFWLSSLSHFISLLLPFASLYDSELSSRLLCGISLDCGAAWVPDVVNYLLYLGLILLLMLAFSMGILVNYLLRNALRQKKFLDLCALYFIFLVFVSPQIGNFITVSSSNKLTILFVGLGMIITRCLKFKKPLELSIL